jgi:hypothetical protein
MNKNIQFSKIYIAEPINDQKRTQQMMKLIRIKIGDKNV